MRKFSAAVLACGLFSSGLFAQNDPLKEAVASGDVAKVQQLVSTAGGARSAQGFEALLEAARTGKLAIADALLKSGVNPNRVDTKHRRLPLLLAIQGKHAQLVTLLLDRGADPNLVGKCLERNCTSHPALVFAVYSRQPEIVKQLLDRRADLHWNDDAATQQANMGNDVAMYEMLVKAGGRPWKIHPYAKNPPRDQNGMPAPIRPSTEPELPQFRLSELLPCAADQAPAPAKSIAQRQRLAVISDEPNRAAADLVIAALQNEPSLEFVERDELTRVITEQKLGDFSKPTAAAVNNLGRLLRADLLVLIRNEDLGGNKTQQIRVIRTGTGVVLGSSVRPIAAAPTNEGTDSAAALIKQLSRKGQSAQAVAISLLNIRSAVGTAAGKQLEGALTSLLAHEVAREPGMILLERREMERLANEAGPSGSSFWKGKYLLEGTVEPSLDDSGSFSLSLSLKPVGKGTPLTATSTGNLGNPRAALDATLASLRAQLKQENPARTETRNEADDFVKEAIWAERVGLYAQASQAAEAAWALGARTPETARLRVIPVARQLSEAYLAIERQFPEARWGWQWRDVFNHPLRRPSSPTLDEVLEMGQTIVDRWREPLTAQIIRSPQERREWLGIADQVVRAAVLALLSCDTAKEQINHREKLAALRAATVEALDLAVKEAAADPEALTVYRTLAVTKAKASAALYAEPSRLLAEWDQLLALGEPKLDLATRDAIRSAIVDGSDSTSIQVQGTRLSAPSNPVPTPWVLPARTALLNRTTSPKSYEDRKALLSAQFRGTKRGSAEQARIARDVMQLALETAPSVAKEEKSQTTLLLWLQSFRQTGRALDPNYPLSSAYSEAHGGTYIYSEQTVAYRRKLLITLLESGAAPTLALKDLLDGKQYDAAAAGEVRTAIRRWLTTVNVSTASMGSVTRHQFAEFAAIGEPVAQNPAASTPLTVSRAWQAYQHGVGTDRAFRVIWNSAVWSEDVFWFIGISEPHPGFEGERRRILFRVDPSSFATELFEIPQYKPEQDVKNSMLQVDGRLIVTPQRVFYAAENRFLAVLTRATKEWRIMGDIVPTRGAFKVLGEFLYVTTRIDNENALIQLDPKTLTSTILASGRRSPAVSPLDAPRLSVTSVREIAGGEISIYASGNLGGGSELKRALYLYNPAQKTWRLAPDQNWTPSKAGTGSRGFTHIFNLQERGAPPNRADVLTLKLSPQAAEAEELPLKFTPPGSLIDQSQWGKYLSLLNVHASPVYTCEAGLFIASSGAGFWFTPRQEFENYLTGRKLSPIDLTANANATE